MEQLFTEFWEAYPKKEVPNKAKREFQKLIPDRKLLTRILDWLKNAKLSKQWQCVELIPLPAAFLSQRYWESDPPQPVRNRNLVGLSCAEAADGCSCDLCEGTGRLIVVFSEDSGNSGQVVGCASWSPIREKMLAGKGQEARLFRCGCESGRDYSQLEIWVPEPI